MLARLERYQYPLLAAAVLLLLAGLLLRDLFSSDPPALIVRGPDDALDGSVVVHVAGAVAAPGVYELPGGARVQDAVVAAGGALPQADLEAVNLARHVRDGEKVTLPLAEAASRATSSGTAPEQVLDINRASAAELDRLPGIGEAYSRRIVDSRAVDGPYRSLEDLVSRRVLPAATLAAVRDYLTVVP